MSMLLRPQGSGDVLAALHDLPALIIDTEDACLLYTSGSPDSSGTSYPHSHGA